MPPTNNLWYTIVVVLFALSLIAERIANLIKLHTKELRLSKGSKEGEKIRERSVMWVALGCGWFVSLIAGGDFYTLIKTGNLLNYSDLLPNIKNGDFFILFRTLLGILLTGVFISLGSKFWHDMMDIVLQFSNLKKYQANQAAAIDSSDNNALLTPKIKLIEPKLKRVAGYQGYELDSGQIQLKFDAAQQPVPADLAWIDQFLGDGNYTIVPTNLKLHDQ